MVDILLAHSYFLKYDAKQTAKMKPYPPLATLYAAALLRDRGYSVALFDAMLSDGEHEFEAALRQHSPRFVAVYEDNFNFLTKMCLGRMRDAAQRMAEIARRSGASVIAAGPDVGDHPDLYFRHGVQFALVGEGENSLVELMDALFGRHPGPILSIAGVAVPDPDLPGIVRRGPERTPERSLDCFPYPAWDLLDVERYRERWKIAHGYFGLNLVTTRGCPFHCNWCAKPIWGQRYAIRSPANVAGEMALLKRTLRPDHFWFADDIFGLRSEWVKEFEREVTALDAAVPFTIQSRADLITLEVARDLARAGCVEVWMGAESGSQKTLDAMDKGITVDEIAAARAYLKGAGVRACFFIQFGYPGETFEDILATVRMIRDTLPDDIGVSVSYPLPGTRFHEMVAEQLGPKTNWSDSGDLAMMFQGTYTTPFYRSLHDLLHLDLKLRQRMVSGQISSELLVDLDRLNHAWLELGRLEAEHRSAAPTRIPKRNGVLARPDLSKRE
ncbi:MAG TPA: radical SAM protein [Armatimonadota bacterium]|nr:radical SAM protein [Armatimonadota bacterium]